MPRRGLLRAIASDVSPFDAQRFLVRTGDMSLTVGKGGVPQAAARVVALTSGFGGYVLTSQVSSADGSSAPYAALSVRVPAAVYDTAIRRFGALGHVQSVQTSATDVTSQSVDLNARLAQARRVDQRLLGFLAQATTVSEALAVQTRIDATELKVEELTGQLKALHEQVAYGTLAVSIAERAAPRAPAHRDGVPRRPVVVVASPGGRLRRHRRGLRRRAALRRAARRAGLVAWYGARVAARWRRSRPAGLRPATRPEPAAAGARRGRGMSRRWE